MTFEESLKRLGIEDYKARIFNSNSHGELIHLIDYVEMANLGIDRNVFRFLFMECVDFCEKNWTRPESCFQHMPKLLTQLTSIK